MADPIVKYRNDGIGEFSCVMAVRASGCEELFVATGSDAVSERYAEFLNAYCTGAASAMIERIQGCGRRSEMIGNLIEAERDRQQREDRRHD